MKKLWLGTRLLAGALSLCLLFFAAVRLLRLPGAEALPAAGQGAGHVFVLDAGHGGEDGGAIGTDGTREKDLNLAVTRILGQMLQAAGQQVVYTRTADRLLYTEAQNIRGQRKVYDLKNRLAIAEETEGAILVSIHMNKYPSPKYSGLQVYYGKGNAEGQRLASLVQAGVAADLQPNNRRAPHAAGDEIYLLHRATVPAVLIECGFLSNPAECQKLSEEDYQIRLSFSIFCAMMEYISEDGG